MSASPTPRKINPSSLSLIDEINVRQDEVIGQLDELNKEIENLIELCLATAKREAGEVEEDTTIGEGVAGRVDEVVEDSNSDESTQERADSRAA